ncbi:glycosyltransferase [Psychroflexus salis]|uniref:Uncharacterized protein n=1 Tax=Psychroflexus salis TaxID=1526574 RepID=A0A916ZMM1_9FLAO|nr:glycosyltransferase [Psychroflexus salis]GGE05088.1 hypothetical protein GCM10010831_03440 [Psychroflexus salis]
MTTDKLKVFHGLFNYGTQAGLFARELRRKNIYAKSYVIEDNSKRVNDNQLKLGVNFFDRLFFKLINFLKLIYAFFKYNTFHFYFGKTLLPYQIDLPFYRYFKKVVIMEYLGNDIRHYEWIIKRYKLENGHIFVKNKSHDSRIKSRLKNEFKYIDYSLCCLPTHMEFSKQFGFEVNELLPISLDFNDFEFTPILNLENRKIRILHAPTHRVFKGTNYIENAIEDLQKDGYQIDFKIIENVTHAELQKYYKWCDIYIDQISVGWYGTAALEAMAYGKVACAFIDKIYLKYLPKNIKSPVFNIEKSNLKKNLKYLLDNKKDLHRWGLESRNFVHNNHSISKTSDRLISLYLNLHKLKSN